LNPARRSRTALVLALMLCLGSCAGVVTGPADPGMFRIAPSAAGRQISVTQVVRVERAGAPPFEVLAALELDARGLRVAALGPLGNRILFLEWDGSAYHEERDPEVPADFPLELILRDLQLVLFPAAAVRQALPPGGAWSLSDTPYRRVLSLDGEPVIAIDYSAEDHFSADVSFHHLTLGYAIAIRRADSE
jgi:uncharacterized protein DUF3261